MSAQSHRSDPRILGRRTLDRDHRSLAALLRPGLNVLDVGCGTGSITVGIANAVGPLGQVVGIDRDLTLLELARKEHANVANLRFEAGDATTLSPSPQFDIVTAARTLQWIPEPALALEKMTQSLKPSGTLVVLDYNHVANTWEPEPPEPFKRFYSAFLAWRTANRCDNQIADRLPQLFHSAGLIDVYTECQNEVVERGDPGFAGRTAIWLDVIESIGEHIATAGFCTTAQLEQARTSYGPWIRQVLVRQTLAMKAAIGSAPRKNGAGGPHSAAR